MVKATQLRPGMIIQHEGNLYTVFSVEHRTPGNKRGSMQTKMRNLRTGSIIDYRFRAEDFVERAIVDEVEFEYLYGDGEGYHFMNTQTFEQISLTSDVLGEAVYYLIGNMQVKLEFYEGKPIGVVLPDTVDLTVVETEPTVRGQTASSSYKPALLSNGVRTMVPPHIAAGTRIVVMTADASYVERAKD